MPLLQIDHLKKYFKNIKAVDDVSFCVEKGDILGLLGPNGAGKSTTISMIATLLAPDSGTIRYKGQDILKEPKSIQQSLGLVPQEIALYPSLSGRENLIFWGKAYGLGGNALSKRIDAVSGIIGITDRLGDKVKKYSGGMKRRLNIGAALLHEPEFIIMDEPTVGIDPQSRNHILDTVKALARDGATIIYTSHYMEEVETLCSRVCIMDYGHIIAAGTKEEITSSLGGQFEISVKLGKEDKALSEKLGALGCVSAISMEEAEIRIAAKAEDASAKAILKVIAASDADLVSFDIEKATLETVFLNLTGRALRD
ncbi:MAG: ABC transporter ATP-binding protein [Eubacteriales bacterium]|nr:ABC transporter ATP-binding protein [Eubacteriales bacterium]